MFSGTMGPPMARLVLVPCALVALCAPAMARPASTGWYAEGAAGATAFLLGASDDAAIGPGLTIRAGRDLASFVSVGIWLATSSHEATVPAPPEGEWFQLHRGGADLRLSGRFDRLSVFIEGGAGVAMISSNVLGRVRITEPGEELSLIAQAGAGLEYQLLNRHYALGVGVDGMMMPAFTAPASKPLTALESRLFLRYTY